MSQQHSRRDDNQGSHFWQSYSDMMVTLLLVFILVLMGTILKYNDMQTELETAISVAESNAADAAYRESVARDEEAKAQALADENQEKADQLEKMLGVREEIIKALREAFDGQDQKLSVDPKTGAIVLSEDVLKFEFNGDAISQEGKDFLDAFIPKYMEVLLSEQFRDSIAEIVIEGHTDDNETYGYNLGLSLRRAQAVADYCLGDGQQMFTDQAKLEEIRSYVTVCGRSKMDPVLNADGTVNRESSRRVEIKFVLKDDETIQKMYDLLTGE